MGTLEGKTAFITGAGRGLGRTLAVEVARAGADVIAVDVTRDLDGVPYALATPEDLERTRQLVEETGRRCLTQVANVVNAPEVDAAVAAGIDAFGGIDILINNAGVASPAAVVDMDDNAWWMTVEVNVSGLFHAIRAVTPSMVERGSGRIVAVSSVLARRGMGNMANYSASQWAILGLIKSVAAELGPHDITANAVCPSFIDTPMLEGMHIGTLLRPDLTEPTPEETEQALRQQHLLPMATVPAEDVAQAVLYLASDAARSITATALDVAAGLSIQYAA